MTSTDEVLAAARASVLHDLTATGVAEPATVSMLEDAVASRRSWVEAWPDGAAYATGLVAQDVQDALLDARGRWPLCPLCEEATHAVHVQPDLGGPAPVWVCEETGRAVAPVGRFPAPPAAP